MASEAEPAKKLLPYLQRADELQKHEPVVAYYCRLYAMEKGLIIPTKERTKTTNSILVSLMNQLEKDKKSVKLSLDDNLYVEGFASNIFAKADKQDRAGRADQNTAKSFYAAYIFFDILNQFGELQPDIEQKMKYSLWKVADIRKALKEGRKPEPGPPGGDPDLPVKADTMVNTNKNLKPSSSFSIRSTGQETQDASPPPVDKDLKRHMSFSSTGQPDHETSSLHLDKSTSLPPTSHPSFSNPDYPSADIHPKNSDFPQIYHPQQSYPTDQPPNNYLSSHDPQNYNDHSPSDIHHVPSNSSENADYQQSYPTDQAPSNYPTHNPLNYHSDRPSQNYYPQEPPRPSYPTNETPPIFSSQLVTPPQNFHSQDSSLHSFPDFQTYPSFNDHAIPTVPKQYTSQPSYQDSSDAPSTSPGNHNQAAQYISGNGNGTHSINKISAPVSYAYDSRYQPSVEKIADAQKAAKLAIGSIAFDDIPVAVDYLRRAIELLTNPTA